MDSQGIRFQNQISIIHRRNENSAKERQKNLRLCLSLDQLFPQRKIFQRFPQKIFQFLPHQMLSLLQQTVSFQYLYFISIQSSMPFFAFQQGILNILKTTYMPSTFHRNFR